MFGSPKTLREVCLDFICDNVLGLCTLHVADTGEHSPDSLHASNYDETMPRVSNEGSSSSTSKLSFRYPNIFLPTEISEELLSYLCERKTLSDLTITLFDSKSTRLRHVRLKDASALSVQGLKVLKQHKVTDLVVDGLKVTVNDLINCLGEWSLQHLRSLSVAKGSFTTCSRYCVVVTLSKLRALHTLNVSGTEFNKHGLEIVVEDLPFLENLDISCTKVDDITPLKKCKNRLKKLSMYNLKINGSVNLTSVLLELNEIRNLDISSDKDTHALDSVLGPLKPKMTRFLKALWCMPYLSSLDLSGMDDLNVDDLKEFIKAHPSLSFLGLVYCDACYEDYRPGLIVSGTATESQILEALRRYTHRPVYVEKCLFHLFRLMPSFPEPRVDIIMLVLFAMREHPQLFRVQVVATACLYKLTKDDLATKIHPSILKQVVEVTMVAMDLHPNSYQLQKNTLLTLCSDRILHDVAFDKYRCATLVMNCLLTFDDLLTNRMAVALFSVLATKMSSVETSVLSAQPQLMCKLLAMVQSTIESKSVTMAMKFTLSVLWSLTDENATACKMFFDKGGMELAFQLLENFQGDSSVEIKVLGLLNNLAEVAHLRSKLMQPRLIVMLSMFLDSEHINVSYFAAGASANLLSDGPLAWCASPTIPSRNELLEQLACTVAKWKTPLVEIVKYKSFQPFIPLLRCSDVYPVQLWAVWAIHHVCTKSPKYYCNMLVGDGIVELLKSLENTYTDSTTLSKLQSLCQGIFQTLKLHS